MPDKEGLSKELLTRINNQAAWAADRIQLHLEGDSGNEEALSDEAKDYIVDAVYGELLSLAKDLTKKE